jgi:hypothetical protein
VRPIPQFPSFTPSPSHPITVSPPHPPTTTSRSSPTTSPRSSSAASSPGKPQPFFAFARACSKLGPTRAAEQQLGESLADIATGLLGPGEWSGGEPM